MRRDSAKCLVEFYPVAAVPTTGCAVPLLGITLNSVNVPFGFFGEEKLQLYYCMQQLIPALA